MNLNTLCLRIKIGDTSAIKELFSDYRVKALMNGAIYRVIRKNPEYTKEYLYVTLQNELWYEVYHNYRRAEDTEKGDNLVLRFLKSVAYNKLLNFVKKEKSLIWNNGEYHRKYSTIDIDENNEVESDEDLEIALENTDLTSIVRRSINEAVNTKKITVNDAQILIFKFKNDMEHEEIKRILKRQLDMQCSTSWISQRVAESIKALKPILIKNNIGAYV